MAFLAALSEGPTHASDIVAPRASPTEVQADVNAIAHQLSQVRDADTPLSCGKAVDNARSGVETMLEVSAKNLRAGYLTQAAYEAATPALQSLLGY